MLGFVKISSGELRDPYTFRTFYVSLVCLKFEYASGPFYDVHVNRIEFVQIDK
jgi:hypothetical protein